MSCRTPRLSSLLMMLCLLPAPLLALRLHIPTLSSRLSVWVLSLSWIRDSGDPDSIELKATCPQGLLFDISTSVTVEPNTIISVEISPGNVTNLIFATVPCYLIAYANSSTKDLMTISSGFKAMNSTLKGIPNIVNFVDQDGTLTASGISSSHIPTASTTPTRAPEGPPILIGGILGGFGFLALILVLGFLYRRRKKASWTTIDSQKSLRIPAPSRNCAQYLIPYPMLHDENYKQPESKQDRIDRARREMEEAQRLRNAFQLDLEHQGNAITHDDSSVEGGLETARTLGLQAQIQHISLMIAALQAEIQRQAEENSGPPDYSSALGS
ncbi:hypothetical protein BDZ94DRAFT_1254073 [Collybia nuda]|uniref:Uncharacterized protein n=1 Tax=Collybia nuda TaxID=64659 RepID=A0A9P5YBA1_9AGAR|nr:hypothetical protein BDZ94DRAFT_1254073 [Collybia nuda]